ncbi:unnamed protein product [Ectocarpus sp. 12 AP-2014]
MMPHDRFALPPLSLLGAAAARFLSCNKEDGDRTPPPPGEQHLMFFTQRTTTTRCLPVLQPRLPTTSVTTTVRCTPPYALIVGVFFPRRCDMQKRLPATAVASNHR